MRNPITGFKCAACGGGRGLLLDEHEREIASPGTGPQGWSREQKWQCKRCRRITRLARGTVNGENYREEELISDPAQQKQVIDRATDRFVRDARVYEDEGHESNPHLGIPPD